MEKNYNSVSDPQPIMFGWFIALLLVGTLAALSVTDFYLAGRLMDGGLISPPDGSLCVMSFGMTAIVLLVVFKFVPAYWRRNRHGRLVLIYKFRNSRETIECILPQGKSPYEYVASLSGNILRDGRYVTYWQGGWFKPPGQFVCIRGGRIIDQECTINPSGWIDCNLLQQRISVRDKFGNKVATSPVQLITLSEAAGGKSFDWRDAPNRLAERLAMIDRVVEPKAGSRHTFS